MQTSGRFHKSSPSIPSWIEYTRDVILLCHCGDASSSNNTGSDYPNSATAPKTNASNNIQRFIPTKQYEISSSRERWFSIGTSNNNFMSSCLMMGQNLKDLDGDGSAIEIEYGVLSRNLQDDYELHRV